MSVYAFTSNGTEEEKNEFYEILKNKQKKHQNKGPTYVMGDFNARVQNRTDEGESMVGPHTFDRENSTVEGQKEGVADNRQRFLTYCNTCGIKILNTYFVFNFKIICV